MSKFSPCRYCEGNNQHFSFNEYTRFGEPPIFSDFTVVCSCGNRTIEKHDSFDLALEQWNLENQLEPNEAERICKNCLHKSSIGIIYRCGMHNNKQIYLTDTCEEFLGW